MTNTKSTPIVQRAADALRLLAEMGNSFPDEEIRDEASVLAQKYISRLKELQSDPDTPPDVRTEIASILRSLLSS